ncbi:MULTISPECIES: hypothetical protein [Methylorubrum]|uniref:hypothetical protein n=1 Tax=Methylorubrum TaxID=2282523 RepID=UPI00209DFEC1|nr:MULTISPECIES: hypothetical protein [Methylorubrum]MCP1548666.1 hypothetical protein [Methylorubrum zatmanii]MCP1554720.1 hypothetical protein [Methylorubrum extorquens]MCP1578969.1 hypothetical protein [Methylorubrum extorquens]
MSASLVVWSKSGSDRAVAQDWTAPAAALAPNSSRHSISAKVSVETERTVS